MGKKTVQSKQYHSKGPSSAKKVARKDSGPTKHAIGNKIHRSTLDKVKTDFVNKELRDSAINKFSAIHFLPESAEENPTFNYSEILPLLKYLGYTQEESSELLETNSSTISRWKNSDKPVDIGRLRSKVVLDIDGIVSKGVGIFGNEELFQEWLNTSNYALGDVRPVELLKDVYSIELVEDALEALSWGSYL